MPKALVLNATFEPLSVVGERRAVVLVLNGRAVVLESQNQIWRSESMSIAVPSVLKLTSFVRVPFQRTAALTRRAVFGRDGHRCQYCNGPAESIDHVVPRSRGGLHTWDNVVACCRRCNVRKGSSLVHEAGLELASMPGKPDRHAWVYALSGQSVDPSWRGYLMAV